jgi:hypothetical protein
MGAQYHRILLYHSVKHSKYNDSQHRIMRHTMNNKMIPIALVLATAGLLAMVTTTPLAFAQDYDGDPRSDGDYKSDGEQRSETNEKLDSESDCNFSGKGNTCLQIPINIEAVASAGL